MFPDRPLQVSVTKSASAHVVTQANALKHWSAGTLFRLARALTIREKRR